MLRRHLVALAVLCALAVLLPTNAGAAASAEPTQAGDIELIAALANTDLTWEWIEAGRVDPQAALLLVFGSNEYQARRADLLDGLALLNERIDANALRSQRLDDAHTATEVLEEVALELRQDVLTSLDDGTASVQPATVREAQHALGTVRDRRSLERFTMDRIDLVELRLASVQEMIAGDLARLRDQAGSNAKSIDAALGRFSYVPAEMSNLRSMIQNARSEMLADALIINQERTSVVAVMPELHDLRQVAPSAVGGLSVVTIDAYLRGAHRVQGQCDISWQLLAGIGRVESRHGTLDGAAVRASGQLTTSIYGPLLDGGATEAEARAGEAAAEQEAERVQQEEEAEAAALAEEARAFNAEIWGEDAIERLEELESETSPGTTDSADDEATEDETKTPLFDPLLWGDDLPFSEDDELDDQDEPAEEGDETPDEFAPAGNGFAVIVDTDDGELDGNPRWDRAVGPMQFIPETWSNWATDGTGDGTADPQNMYDSAATAGKFLCHLQQTRGSSPTSFVLGYNSSSTYVRNVLAIAEGLTEFELPEVPQAEVPQG